MRLATAPRRAGRPAAGRRPGVWLLALVLGMTTACPGIARAPADTNATGPGRLLSPQADQEGSVGGGSLLRMHDAASSELQRRREAARMQDVPGLIVRLNASVDHGASSHQEVSALAGVLAAAGQGLRLRRLAGGPAHVFSFERPTTLQQARVVASRLRNVPGVLSIDLDLRISPQMQPNDGQFAAQHSLAEDTIYPGTIDAVNAWNITTGSPQTVIAVIDTGLAAHAELSGRTVPGYDFITSTFQSNDGDGRDPDPTDPGTWVSAEEAQASICSETPSSWHGTYIAGIIAANGNNLQGVAGINWQARLLPVRALGKCGGLTSDVIDAMLWAAGLPVPGVPPNLHPSRLINMSLGAPSPDGCPAAFQAAIRQVRARGAMVVTAAGNNSDDVAHYSPASCEGVVAVAAVNLLGNLASYSNFGGSGQVTVAAPGGDRALGAAAMIVSTSNSGLTAPGVEALSYRQGTSVATAHVTGVVSLAMAVNPSLSLPELTALLKLSTHAFALNSSCATGWPMCGVGIADATHMVLGARSLLPYAVVLEFRKQGTDQYFRTGSAEATVFEDGSQGRWDDTEDYFVAWRDGAAGALPVCRFYHHRDQAHFYTADPQECERLKAGGEWAYQTTPFHAQAPVGGSCPAATKPVHRFARATVAGGYRYRLTANRERLLPELTAQGWKPDGLSFCVVN